MRVFIGIIFLLLFQFKVLGQTTEFYFHNTNYGFICMHNCQLEIDKTAMKIKITGEDPYFLSPMNLNIDARQYHKIKIRINNHTNNRIQLFWITNTDQNWRQELSCRIQVTSNIKNTGFMDYTIDLSKIKTWKGIIYQIRLDPGDGPNPNIRNKDNIRDEYISIEYLKFIK